MGRLTMIRGSTHILVFFLLDHDSYKISGAASEYVLGSPTQTPSGKDKFATELHYWLFYAECTWVVGSLLTE